MLPQPYRAQKRFFKPTDQTARKDQIHDADRAYTLQLELAHVCVGFPWVL